MRLKITLSAEPTAGHFICVNRMLTIISEEGAITTIILQKMQAQRE